MASFTFGSLGDIVTLCGIIRSAVVAVSDSRGSVAEYGSLLKELESLSGALVAVQLLLEQQPDLKENNGLQTVLCGCFECLKAFCDEIKCFEIMNNRKGKISWGATYKKLR